MAQNFSMRSISLNIGNHLKALSMILASRDSSFSFMSSSCLCISLRLWICVSCCFCICCIWLCNFSILVSRFETSSCSFSLACSSSFSFPLPKREATPLVMAVAAVVAVFFSLSGFHLFQFLFGKIYLFFFVPFGSIHALQLGFLFLYDKIVPFQMLLTRDSL